MLNDPKGLWRADFDQTSVSIIFDAMGCTAFFFLWAKQHRCVVLIFPKKYCVPSAEGGLDRFVFVFSLTSRPISMISYEKGIVSAVDAAN